jgi:hypothetical protein
MVAKASVALRISRQMLGEHIIWWYRFGAGAPHSGTSLFLSSYPVTFSYDALFIVLCECIL